MQALRREDSFRDVLRPSGEYSLCGVQLETPDSTTAIFHATLNGREGKPVWARAWLSTEAGTLAEAASPQLMAGDNVRLEIKLYGDAQPQYAYIRIESSPLTTEHVVGLKLN